jgi:hypothetical protein
MREPDKLASELELRKLFLGDPSTPAASGGLLRLSSLQYREYAGGWKSSAQTANSDPARELSLNMANIWLEAAMRCEASLGAGFTERGEEANAVPDRNVVRIHDPQAPRLELDEADRLTAWIEAA